MSMNKSITPLDMLAQQQNDLLAAIFEPHADMPLRGIAAYRAHARASAERALQTAYPVITQLVGDENFGYLARDYWHQHPPSCGDLAQWGSDLPLFIAASKPLADVPYLADVAQIEWTLHVCAGSADRMQNRDSFAALTNHAPACLSFTTAPGVHILPSVYPAAAIALAHKGQGALQDAATLLHAGAAQTALVWRHGFAPRLRVLPEVEQNFTSAVCAGQHLAMALDLAHPDFDFSDWLAANVQNGLLISVDIHHP